MRSSILSTLIIAHCLASFVCADDGIEFFEQRIRPVLIDRCYTCHSAEAAAKKTLKGGLRLDTREALRKGGDSGPAIVPGKSENSLLIDALRHTSLKMPPRTKLPGNVIADFVKWVEMGAPDPRAGRASNSYTIDFEAARRQWVYQAPKMPKQPSVSNKHWTRGAIDHFVLSGLEANGIQPAGQADKRTLIRRTSYDLLGLPPTVEQITAFLNDKSPDAFEKLVDRMLKSPDFGIRWARHWLDNVRYAQDDPTCNANDNGLFDIGPYRDWVVKSLNTDLPYDQFVRMQIAGDLIQPDDPNQIDADGYTATGVWGLAHLVEGNDKEKVIADFVDEQLDVLGRTFMGLTISCSRCHDHKFDPITQADYYALAGIFYSSHIFSFKGKSARVRSRIQQRAVRTEAERQGIEPDVKSLKQLQTQIKQLAEKHEKPIELMEVRNGLKKQLMLKPKTPQQAVAIKSRIRELRRKESRLLDDKKKKGWKEDPPELKQLAKLGVDRDKLTEKLSPFPLRMVMREGPVPGTRHKEPGDLQLFIRGDHLSLGTLVPRAIPQVFATKGAKLEVTGSGRLQLANWLTERNHPLTARVMANRVWQYLMGRGIVATPSNFGKLGQRPTHPELLDYLAIRLIESGWSVKTLIREIMSSRAYQQSSKTTQAAVAGDPENQWYGRMNRKRLDAESLMDALARHSGQGLNGKSHRRLFGEFRRDKPQTTLDLFDGANPDLLAPRRTDSTSAPQALFMLNNEVVLTAAETLARSIISNPNERKRVSWLYVRLFGRLPTSAEQTIAANMIADSLKVRRRIAIARGAQEDDEAGAWEDLCLALICSNEFLYID